MGEPAVNDCHGGREAGQLLAGAGERVGRERDQVGRRADNEGAGGLAPRKRAPATVYSRSASCLVIACSGPSVPAGVARVVIPATARSGRSGPIG